VRFLKIFGGKNIAPPSEAHQLAAYRKLGDVTLLGALYQPYMDFVFAICYQYLRDEDDCKDAVMQIFEKLVIELRTHEVDHFKTWLHSVTRNFCLMQLRARKTFANVEELDPENAHMQLIAPETDEALFTENKLVALESCLKTLIPEQQNAIDLFYMKQKCYREICEETGYDAKKVKSYIQNGKRNLKICMEKNGR
jgi:RNA polymerase sigma-70 factor (ECF subfamily)